MNAYLLLIFLLRIFSPGEVYAVSPAVKPVRDVPCIGCHGSLKGRNFLHGWRYARSVHGDLSCMECHAAKRIRAIDSVHRESVAPLRPDRPAPAPPLRKKSAFPDALSACRRCHPKVFRAVKNSVHGTAIFKKGISCGAFCLDCHAPIHYLKPIHAGTSSVARQNLVDTCSRCHADRTIASRYHLNVYVVQSYKAHFHGKKTRLGGRETPTCIDCHGHHAIRNVADPTAPVSPAHKVALCARCHRGATPEFAALFTHQPLNAAFNPAAFQIRRVLVLLLGGIVLLLTFHIFLEFYDRYRRGRKVAMPLHIRAGISWSSYRRLPRKVPRMDLHLRIQHALLLVAVFSLGASGLALKFPDWAFARVWIRIWGNVENAGHLHRFAALLLILDLVYHLFYLVIRKVRGRLRGSLLPSRSDGTLLRANLRYLSGRTNRRPAFEKFSYTQKLDYWLVALVVVSMTVTGLMYWFPTETARLLPESMVPQIWGIAYVIHSTEALLILFVAFVWHFYNVHLKSPVFPMSWVWLTGQIDLEDLWTEHGAEFDELAREVEDDRREQEDTPRPP